MSAHKSFLGLHRTRGVSALASEFLTRSHGERGGRALTAKARQAGLNVIEAFARGSRPAEEDTLVFFDAVAPTHTKWLREQIAKAVALEEFWMPEDE